MHERFVGGKEAVPAGEQVAFQPSFQRMLAEHLHHAAIEGHLRAVGVFREICAQPDLLGGFVDLFQFVRGRFIRTEEAEVARITAENVAQEFGQRRRIRPFGGGRLLHWHGVIAERRQTKRLPDEPAIRDGIGAHALRTRRAPKL